MDVAITDLILSKLFPFKFGEDKKLLKALSIARRLLLNYVPPNRNRLGGDLLHKLYDGNIFGFIKPSPFR